MLAPSNVIIVLVDSKTDDLKQLKSDLSPLGQCQGFSEGQAALEYCLAHPQTSLVVTEYRLPGMGGLELIEALRAQLPFLPLLMVAGPSHSAAAIKAVQAGAYDVIPKPYCAQELREVASEALRESPVNRALPALSAPVEADQTPSLVGQSRAMAKLYGDIAKLAATPFTVLIQGETGTGKELVARSIHQYGHRAHKPFITVNCAAIPENLLESELFGHEKGSFTGASSRKIGKFEQAHGATLFLDEIGDMHPLLQAKMLRVLQEKVVQRVGGGEEIPIDLKVVTATHQNLGQMVQEGTFRADLLYRLQSSSLKIPPLRDRLGDIALLAQHFLQLYSGTLGVEPLALSREAFSFLERQYWPGNVRQLQNVIRQALLKRRHLPIRASDFATVLQNSEPALGVAPDQSLRALVSHLLAQTSPEQLEESEGIYRQLIRQVERVLLAETLRRTNGNQALAARWLGMTRSTLREKRRRMEHQSKAGEA